MPIFVKETYEGNFDAAFWQWAQEKGYAYLKDQHSTICAPPTSWTDLYDDPIRYFIAIAARKFEKPSCSIEKSTGALKPLWVKIGKGRRYFIEYELVNRLVEHGFAYQYGEEKNAERFQELIEQARAILLQWPVEGADVLSTCMKYQENPEIQALLH